MNVELYMCATEYDHELGHVVAKVYPSIEKLKAERPCIPECGIVAVQVELIRVVEPGLPYSQRGR